MKKNSKTKKQLPFTWTMTKRKVKDIFPVSYNPKKMEENERRDLEDSIKKFGTAVPVVLNIGTRNNFLINGHQRLKIYADLNIEEIDVMIPSRELSEKEEMTLNLRLSKNLGSWDEAKLKDLDTDLLLEVGFGDDELQNLFDDVDVIDDDFNVEKAIRETKVSRVKPGEIWELGENRLLVGDSTSPEQVQKLMGNELADVVYCDAPYNIGLNYSDGIGTNGKYQGQYGGHTRKEGAKDFPDLKFKNMKMSDNKTVEKYTEFIDSSIKNALSVAKPNCHFFYWCDEKFIWLIQTLYAQNKIENKRVCLWIKNNQNCTPQIAFNKAYEPCCYGLIGKPHLNKNIKNANEMLNQEIGSGNQVHEEIIDMLNIWLEKRDNAQDYQHPTQKPVTLNEKPLKRCSAPGHIVFSGFAGGGSDLIACEQLGRKWRGVEIDLIFATVCLDRWEAFTNKKAKLIS